MKNRKKNANAAEKLRILKCGLIYLFFAPVEILLPSWQMTPEHILTIHITSEYEYNYKLHSLCRCYTFAMCTFDGGGGGDYALVNFVLHLATPSHPSPLRPVSLTQ